MIKRAIVTGGTRGIGASIAIALKEAGYNVAAVYASNDKTAENFSNSHKIEVFKFNTSNFDSCAENIALIKQRLGGSIDVLVNNAGITRDGMMHKMPKDNWYDVINVNLNSAFNMSRSVIEEMRNNKFGRIVNISSVNANGQIGQTNYSATKAAIEGFTKALALENAKLGITVNAIAPGYISTEMVANMPQDVLEKIVARVPAGRLGKPEEIARAVLFLVDDNAGFITGTTIAVNGGLRV